MMTDNELQDKVNSVAFKVASLIKDFQRSISEMPLAQQHALSEYFNARVARGIHGQTNVIIDYPGLVTEKEENEEDKSKTEADQVCE